MYVGITYLGLVTNEYIYLKMLGIIILSTLLTDVIKRLPYKSFYNGAYLYKITRRPKGACDCDYLSKNGDCKENASGFPSGHMATASSFSVLMILFFMRKYKVSLNELITLNPMIVFISTILVPLMGWSRYYKQCHTLLQITCGTVLGVAISLLLF
jgi:membrane-associated phospholipid phosphatase